MTLHDIPLTMLDERVTTVGEFAGRAVLVVNVASRCGLTPQYGGLETLATDYADRGLTVLGVPCNQFGGQEPGTAQEIAQFCSATYGVSFPLTAKTDVNGGDRHPLFETLTEHPDAEGYTGDVRWNFEKWLLSPTGEVVARFSPQTEPGDPAVAAALAAALPTG
ncbi:MAG TPA: glutathione peroxidase [Candidatus Nanopelagicales bacterium]|nr:glutathione peroxidase [Candidatus Nanopelagicales bacterium]